MRFPRHLLLPALVVLALLPVAARAQGPGLVRLRGAIEATDHRIDLAAAVVSPSGDEQARGELARAREFQAQARSAAAEGRPLLAGQLTIEARGRADHAVELVRGLPAPDRVMTQLERTRGMLDRAVGRIEACGDDRAREMLGVAREMQQRAERAEREQRHLGALQLTLGARERGTRALRLCRIEEDVQEVAEQALGRTDQVLARARSQRPPGAPGHAVRQRERGPSLLAAGRRVAGVQGRALHCEPGAHTGCASPRSPRRGSRAAGVLAAGPARGARPLLLLRPA